VKHLISVALLLTPGVASAQQSIAPTAPWSGAYAGITGGLTIHRASTATVVAAPGAYFITTDPAQIAEAGRGTISAVRGMGGLRSGYDWHPSSALIGIAIDLDWMPATAARSLTTRYLSYAASFTTTQSITSHWLVTLRPRIGIRAGRSLAYATGGIAVDESRYSSTFTDRAYAALEHTVTPPRTKGWIAGGGVERSLVGKWTWNAEYLFLNLPPASMTGSVTQRYGAAGVLLRDSVELRRHVVRVGVDYHFSSKQ